MVCFDLNEIIRHTHDEIQTSLDEIKSVFLFLQSKISLQSDFVSEVDSSRRKTDLVKKRLF